MGEGEEEAAFLSDDVGVLLEFLYEDLAGVLFVAEAFLEGGPEG